jgi:hypothetical protein
VGSRFGRKGYNKINLREIGLEDVDWIYLTQIWFQRQILANTMNLSVPYMAGNFWFR